jgi:hypothetical protein
MLQVMVGCCRLQKRTVWQVVFTIMAFCNRRFRPEVSESEHPLCLQGDGALMSIATRAIRDFSGQEGRGAAPVPIRVWRIQRPDVSSDPRSICGVGGRSHPAPPACLRLANKQRKRKHCLIHLEYNPPPMTRCAQCGGEMAEGARFCASCGKPASPFTELPTEAPTPRTPPRLGPRVGGGPVCAGRSAG